MSEKTLELLKSIGIDILIVIVGLILLKVILALCKKVLNKSSMDNALHAFILNAIKTLFIIALGVAVLDRVGFDTKSLVTMLGVSGAAIALALKDSLSNVAGGMIILITKPFSQDDYVDISGTTGTVKKIDLLLTTLVTYDNKIITIPNGLVSTSVLTNFSKANTRRVDCIFGIGYQDDINRAKEVMMEVAKKNPNIRFDKDPIIGVSSNANHCIMIDFKVWTDTENYWDVKYYLEENVKLAFDKVGITIPYPQMDVHFSK
ncbi:MAG: mechanosensitive ion channel family protein [Anaerovoracaceae bacterium]